MVTPCPLCHLSLDALQSKLKAATGREYNLPILHLSQLVGVAAGLEESELKFKRHVVSVAPVVEKLQIWAPSPRASGSWLSSRPLLSPPAGSRRAGCGCARSRGGC